ncbi:MAG: hypothetical protein MUF84_02670 [Anaerolineae bacterium]|jgi:hypothetical protein|nr:hypothetical protein [Anaerolineae bacterium]
MIIKWEYADERPDRICHVVQRGVGSGDDIRQHEHVAIDEDHLSWFYVAPGTELSALSLRLLALARDLLGPGYWAVMQVHELGRGDLLGTCRCHVLESYVDGAESPVSISVHIVQGD